MRRRIMGGGIDYSKEYLTFVSLADNNTIGLKYTGSVSKTVSVSTDGGSTWTSVTSSTGGTTLATLNTGDKLLIKGSNTQYATGGSNYNYFTATQDFNIYGNIMSLVGGDSFADLTSLTSNYAFLRLFYNCSNMKDATNLIMPATTLKSACYYGTFRGCSGMTGAPALPAITLQTQCYYQMFFGCSSLTTAPVLPSTTLANTCYSYMFYGCTSLTTAPVLSATILMYNCYSFMFSNCTSLTTAPVLSATTLAESCYQAMFSGCSNMNSITCLATDISASTCLQNWVRNVAASGTFIKDSTMTGWPTGTSGIPSGWTVVDY